MKRQIVCFVNHFLSVKNNFSVVKKKSKDLMLFFFLYIYISVDRWREGYKMLTFIIYVLRKRESKDESFSSY